MCGMTITCTGKLFNLFVPRMLCGLQMLLQLPIQFLTKHENIHDFDSINEEVRLTSKSISACLIIDMFELSMQFTKCCCTLCQTLSLKQITAGRTPGLFRWPCKNSSSVTLLSRTSSNQGYRPTALSKFSWRLVSSLPCQPYLWL